MPSLEAASKLTPAPNNDPFIGVGLGFEFNPLDIKQEGIIQVSAVKGDKRYRLGALRVVSRPPKEAAN
jgi:hypothetical protein